VAAQGVLRLQADRDAVEARVSRAFKRSQVAIKADHLCAALEAPQKRMRRGPVAGWRVSGEPLMTAQLNDPNRCSADAPSRSLLAPTTSAVSDLR
jgi:hypothetical protein